MAPTDILHLDIRSIECMHTLNTPKNPQYQIINLEVLQGVFCSRGLLNFFTTYGNYQLFSS